MEKWKYVGIRVLLEQWNSVGGTVWWKSEVEQCWWKSVVEQRNNVGRTVEQCWWNSVGGTVWWNSGTVMDEQCGGTLIVKT